MIRQFDVTEADCLPPRADWWEAGKSRRWSDARRDRPSCALALTGRGILIIGRGSGVVCGWFLWSSSISLRTRRDMTGKILLFAPSVRP